MNIFPQPCSIVRRQFEIIKAVKAIFKVKLCKKQNDDSENKKTLRVKQFAEKALFWKNMFMKYFMKTEKVNYNRR